LGVAVRAFRVGFSRGGVTTGHANKRGENKEKQRCVSRVRRISRVSGMTPAEKGHWVSLAEQRGGGV